LAARRKVWRKVYGEISDGKTITGLMRSLDENDTAEIDVEPFQPKKTTQQTTQVKSTFAPPSVVAQKPEMDEAPTTPKPPTSEKLTDNAPDSSTSDQPETDVEEADRLMGEVYNLLDQAIGNAMVAFSIYRKTKSTRADEALTLLTELHNETKKTE